MIDVIQLEKQLDEALQNETAESFAQWYDKQGYETNMNDTPLHEQQDLTFHNDISGNAPMIPRKEVIDILNTVQMLQTRLVILLQRYEPEHFNGTESKPAQNVWQSDSTGLPPEQVVRTTTGREVL